MLLPADDMLARKGSIGVYTPACVSSGRNGRRCPVVSKCIVKSQPRSIGVRSAKNERVSYIVDMDVTVCVVTENQMFQITRCYKEVDGTRK
jgi:hypothetical protein